VTPGMVKGSRAPELRRHLSVDVGEERGAAHQGCRIVSVESDSLRLVWWNLACSAELSWSEQRLSGLKKEAGAERVSVLSPRGVCALLCTLHSR